MQDSVHGAVAVGDDRDEHDLDRERHHGEPDPADSHLADPAQTTPEKRDGKEQQEECEGEGHAGAGRSIVAICEVRLTSLRA